MPVQPNVKLVPVAEADFDALVELRIAAMRASLECVGRFDAARARERLRSTFSAAHTRFILLEEKRVGFYATRFSPEGLRVEHLYVHPDFQSRGIGGAVLKMVFAEADVLGIPTLVGALKESASNRFYRRHGFAPSGESEWDNYYVRKPAIETKRPHNGRSGEPSK